MSSNTMTSVLGAYMADNSDSYYYNYYSLTKEEPSTNNQLPENVHKQGKKSLPIIHVQFSFFSRSIDLNLM